MEIFYFFLFFLEILYYCLVVFHFTQPKYWWCIWSTEFWVVRFDNVNDDDDNGTFCILFQHFFVSTSFTFTQSVMVVNKTHTQTQTQELPNVFFFRFTQEKIKIKNIPASYIFLWLTLNWSCSDDVWPLMFYFSWPK